MGLVRFQTWPSAIVSGSQHLPEGAALPQGDIRTSPAMDRCATGEGGVWVNPQPVSFYGIRARHLKSFVLISSFLRLINRRALRLRVSDQVTE